MGEVLNLGSGDEAYGTVRMDLYPTRTTNLIADMETGFPFADGVFDEVHSRYTFEHLKNPGHVVSEFFRVLRPGGTFYVLTNNAWFLRGALGVSKPHLGEFKGPLDNHYALFTPEHLEAFLKSAGFMDIEVNFTGWSRKADRMLKLVGLGKLGAQNVYARGTKSPSVSGPG
jgi:SAM-dependent methyltransferase